MKKIQFSTQYDDRVEVLIDGDNYGTLVFDREQNIWVLWPAMIDDGVSYSDDLEETKDIITGEVMAGGKA